MTVALLPSVVPWRDWTAGELGKIGIGVTDAQLTQTQLDSITASTGAKLAGKRGESLNRYYNQRFWFKESVDGIELKIDRTTQPVGFGPNWAGAGNGSSITRNPDGVTNTMLPFADIRSANWAGTSLGGLAAFSQTGNLAYERVAESELRVGDIPLYIEGGVGASGEGYSARASGVARTSFLMAIDDSAFVATRRVRPVNVPQWVFNDATQQWEQKNRFYLEIYALVFSIISTGAVQAHRDLQQAIFGLRGSNEGAKNSAAYFNDLSYTVARTHPGDGWLPSAGLWLQGVHPWLTSISISAEKVVELQLQCTGVELAGAIRAIKEGPGNSVSAQLEAAATALERDVGQRMISWLWRDSEFGPYDIYGCAAVQRALADGASVGDVNDVKVSGKKASEWRSQALAAKPTTMIAWTQDTRKSVRTADAVYTGSGPADGWVLLPVPNTEELVVILPPIPSGEQNAAARPMPSVEVFDAAYPGSNLTTPSEAAALQSMLSAHATTSDMPAVWWQSLGFSELQGLGKTILRSILRPIMTSGS